MENEKFQKVATLLQSDVVADFEWYKKSLYSVLNGKQKKILGVGNLCEIEITPEYTYIYDAVTEDKECCKAKTDELYNTILNWEKDYKSFLENIDRIEPHRLSCAKVKNSDLHGNTKYGIIKITEAPTPLDEA